MYCLVNKPTEYKTLNGKYVTPVKHDTMKKRNEWIDNYQSDLIFGNNLYQYSYLAEQYPNRVDWDIEKLLIVTIDIEVQCENGFPDPEKTKNSYLSLLKITRQKK